MHRKTALKTLAGCLKKIGDPKVSGAGQKFEETQGEIKITRSARGDIAGLSALPYPTEGETSSCISKPFW